MDPGPSVSHILITYNKHLGLTFSFSPFFFLSVMRAQTESSKSRVAVNPLGHGVHIPHFM